MHYNQQTVKGPYCFSGKGLHTGKSANIAILPAPADSGIRFVRKDIGDDAVIEALAENVSNTARSTSISSGAATAVTVEHVISALTGLGVDNAIIEIDNMEVPILDGSARMYVEAISRDGTADQGVPRRRIDIPETVEVRDEKTGSYVRIEPADTFSYDVTVDFNSRVLGVQSAHWDAGTDYGSEIGICRTFVFFHELEYLFANNLIKGGDVDNAIVIVEHPVSDEQLGRLSALFNKTRLRIEENGYLDNLRLHFPNECGRHKMLDLIGDLRLAGGFLNARVTAFKPGHTINTMAAKALRQLL